MQAWPTQAAAPTPAPAAIPIADQDEARVMSIDATTGTIRARLTDYGKIIVIRVGNPDLLNSVKVGSAVYVNIQTHAASLDGKTTCCTFTMEMSKQQP